MSPHRDAFVRLVQERGWTSGAELGVDKGILFHMLLTCCPNLSLLGVDLGLKPERRAKCEAIATKHNGRAQFLVARTHDAAGMVSDGAFDFVFIDADHSQRSVAEDITDWQPKVKRGGWLGGHDYNHKFPGVVQAVQKAFGAKVQTWPGSIWGVFV